MTASAPILRPATIHIWSGAFASQALAFAHLMDLGIDDLDRFEVLAANDAGRLDHFGVSGFVPGADQSLVLQVAALNSPAPFQDSDHLTYLGAYSGQRYE